MILIVILIKLQLVEVVLIFVIIFLVLKKIECDHAPRNPRRTTRAEPARNADAQTCGTRAYY